MGVELRVKDSGERTVYGTGAQRDNHSGKGRFDLIPPQFLMRLARWFEMGAEKYEERNFEKGLPIGRCLDAAMRHLTKYQAGCDDEDHLAAAAWNIAAIMFYQEHLPEMQNLPMWKDRYTKWLIKFDMGDN